MELGEGRRDSYSTGRGGNQQVLLSPRGLGDKHRADGRLPLHKVEISISGWRGSETEVEGGAVYQAAGPGKGVLERTPYPKPTLRAKGVRDQTFGACQPKKGITKAEA